MTVAAHTPAGGQAVAVPIRDWQVQSSAVAGGRGELISGVGYRADGWISAPARSTVMAALLCDGQYPDIFFSTRLRDGVDADRFGIPWWYRALFTISAGGRTLLRTDGVIHRAELWVNGVRVAGPDDLAGAYPVHTVDVTDLVSPGANALALQVFPGHPMTDLSIGWIDWNPAPPDANMGVWRDVWVIRTGPVRLADPYVVAEPSESLDRVAVRIGMELDNAGPDERVVTVTGVIARADGGAPAGSGAARRFRTEIPVPPGGAHPVVLTDADVPELRWDDPAVWWPVGQGDQPLYQLRLVVTLDGDLCDQADITFGVRRVTSNLEAGGGRRFVVNGRPIQVLGAGWCPDIFLRYDRQRLLDQLTYVRDLGLNAIRLEGKLENPEFFDIADRLGIMVLPGWECCTKWESHAGTGGAAWSEHDYLTARRSMAAEARLLRNHPCVIGFLIGSDFAPSPRLAEIYLDELRAADWALPIVSSGASSWNNGPGPGEETGPRPDAVTAGVWPDTTTTAGAGPSGMKMWPYDWVPPRYWYDRRFGGAVGFDSECSAGHSIPRMPSLRAMLEPAEIDRLWQRPDAHHYHSAPGAPFDCLQDFHRALAARYGDIGSLADFLRKAQLANYEMVRAQFEAYRGRSTAAEPATGVIYWMLNNAWPSLNWHLFDYYLDPAGAYFGAKKANEPLHVQFGYDTGEVAVVNGTPDAAGPLAVQVRVRGIDGAELAGWRQSVATVPAGGAVVAGAAPPPASDAACATYFVELVLTDGAARPVSRNVYWLSTRPDVLDWDRTSWRHTPQAEYADLTGLQGIPAVRLDVTAVTASEPDPARSEGAGWLPQAVTTVTVRNPTATPAVGVHLSVITADGASPIAPILWQDNDITLFGGQEVAVTARHRMPDRGGPVLLRVEGFNVMPASVRPRSGPPTTVSDR